MVTKATFLHVADVHLGFDRYDSRERSKDFVIAFRDLLQRYAVERHVDFVLIAGDLFEYRTILPNVLNQAESALGLLHRAGIPAIAIEGNHDSRPYGVNTSWLRYLADHDYLILLEPTTTSEGMILECWDPERRRGGYLDLECDVRVIGSAWYGSAAHRSIGQLAEAIQMLPPGPSQQILMFHHGLEGQVARYSGALRYQELLPLQQAGVHYLALGHIHKSYSFEGWIFNPGSVEANSMAECEFERGGFYVELESGHIQATLVKDYWQRPSYRLKYEAKGKETPEELSSLILELVRQSRINSEEAALVEVRILGEIGFQRYEIDLRELQSSIQHLTGALLVLLKLEAISRELDSVSHTADQDQRLAIEEQVYTDLLAGHAHYRKRSEELAKVLLELKEMVLDDRDDVEMYRRLDQAYLERSTGEGEA